MLYEPKHRHRPLFTPLGYAAVAFGGVAFVCFVVATMWVVAAIHEVGFN